MKSNLIDFETFQTQKFHKKMVFLFVKVIADDISMYTVTLNIIISIKQNKLIPGQSQTNTIKFPIT